MTLAPHPSSLLLITLGKEVKLALETKKGKNKKQKQKATLEIERLREKNPQLATVENLFF